MSENRDTKASSARETMKTIVGADDWRKSKVGYLTGFSVGKRVVGNFSRTASDSVSHIGSLVRDLKGTSNVPSLETDSIDPRQRFLESMTLHRVTEKDLVRMQRNSCRTAFLYLFLSLLAVVAAVLSWVLYPPYGAFSTIVRLGALPLVGALAFKHMYTNWILRKRSLYGPIQFVYSLDWFPKK